MIKAVGMAYGRPLMVLGLTGENVTRMAAGEPMQFDGAELGYPGTIVIMYGRDEEALQQAMVKAGMIRGATVVRDERQHTPPDGEVLGRYPGPVRPPRGTMLQPAPGEPSKQTQIEVARDMVAKLPPGATREQLAELVAGMLTGGFRHGYWARGNTMPPAVADGS